ncbi:hypothetical protein WN55_05768, partial [Dufourea novaeangliae]
LSVSLSLYLPRMDTSTCSFTSQSAPQSTAQRKFYQWVLKWISGIHLHTESNEELRDVRNPSRVDVPTLASFLQAIGFKLLSFEKNNDVQKKDETDSSTPKPGILKIAIECGSSKLRAILELGDVTCRCPNPDHVKDASFWSVSGTGPVGSTDNIVHKVEETGSNLLPPLSKDITRVLRDVSNKLFETIVGEPDVNRNTDISLNISRSSNASYEPKVAQEGLRKEIGVVRSYTQPEMRLHTNDLNTKMSISRNTSPLHSRKPILRQKTWDIDMETGNLDAEPRPSPPKRTSSPTMVAELSNSLGQISLQGEIENSKNLAEYIIGAKQNLEKALKMLVEKPIISVDVSLNQDDSVSVKSAPANISPTAVTSPYKPTRSHTISGVRPLIKLTNEKQLLTKPMLGNGQQTPKTRRTLEPVISHSARRKSTHFEQENTKPTVRRRSFYMPSSNSNLSLLSKPSDAGQKWSNTGKYSMAK